MDKKAKSVTRLAGVVHLAASLFCVPIAVWFEFRKPRLSGVPWGHFAMSADGRQFHVPRGGGPVESRPQVPMSEEQYLQWEQNGFIAQSWALPGVSCWLAGPTLLYLTRK
jgi:hypothetical protein